MTACSSNIATAISLTVLIALIVELTAVEYQVQYSAEVLVRDTQESGSGLSQASENSPNANSPSGFSQEFQKPPVDQFQRVRVRSGVGDAAFELTVVHFNDFHARYEPVDVATSGRCRTGSEESCVGGFARLYTLATRLKEEYPISLILNAGDTFTGSFWFSLFKYNVTATFLNMIPQDAMTIGNHEFDTFVPGLVKYLKAVKYPVVAANIDASEEPDLKPLFRKSTIVVKGGKRIGIVGYVTRDYVNIASIGKLRILDEITSLNEEADRLVREDSVDIVIALSHAGVDLDVKVAKACKHVSLIVGGHSHTFLYSGKSPSPFDKPKGPYPITVKSSVDNHQVLVVQAYAYSRYLGLIHLQYDGQNNVVSWQGNPIFLDKHIQQDPQIVELLEPWKQAVDRVGKEVKGSSVVFLDASQGACYVGECNIGQMILQAMIHEEIPHRFRRDTAKSWTYSSIAFINSGGIRTSILEGNITYEDVLGVLPFEDHYSTVEVMGSAIIDALEFSSMDQDVGSPLQVAGLKAIIDMSKPSWNRVSNVQVLCSDCRVPQYKPLDVQKWYPIVVNDFAYNGGDGYRMFKHQSKNYVKGRRDTDIVFDYLAQFSPITQDIPGNLVRVNHKPEAIIKKYKKTIVKIH